ncbi:MAG TPA: tRNA dihydrouridine synthase DusB, partial [Firmicutes bacterium]|nr:tRNA dihydrouridine synthase DusB [Bacillota bacterium]
MSLFEKIKKFPYILAPLAGYTDMPFRTIARHYGASFVFTEMINEHALARFSEKIKKTYEFCENERPIGIQIFGKSSGLFYDAARRAEELGFDMVDINFGCPAGRVANGGSGASLLRDLSAVESIIKQVVRAVEKVPVSIKIRSGWDDKSKNYLEVNKIAEDCGVSMITLHPRTRSQMFRGSAAWDEIKELKENSKLFVAGSGDVFTADDALRMKKETGVDAVMIARGAIAAPYIFRQISEPGFELSREEAVKLSIKHLDMLYEFKGQKGIFEMRKYYKKYIKSFAGVGDMRKTLM